MAKKLAAPLLLCVICAAPVAAQEFTGGEIGVEYNAFTQDTDVSGTSYNAGVEFAFCREYAISVTAENFGFGGDSTTNNITLHGIYHMSSTASVGLFYSRDENEVDGYGIEGGTAVGAGEIGGYVGTKSFGNDNVFIFGLDSRTPINNEFTFFTDFDVVGDEDVAGSTSELGVSYLFDAGPEAFVQVGRASAFTDIGSDSETYIGLGARISFGDKRGSTFETR